MTTQVIDTHKAISLFERYSCFGQQANDMVTVDMVTVLKAAEAKNVVTREGAAAQTLLLLAAVASLLQLI